MIEEKEINTYEYGYNSDQEIQLNAIAVLAMIDLLSEVIETQPRIFASLVYAGNTDEVRDKDGNLVMVNTEWKEHTADSFFMTAVQESGAQPGMTQLALKCEQMRYALQSVHRKNIEQGVARKITELNKEDVLSNLA
jgi:hypothetical protein